MNKNVINLNNNNFGDWKRSNNYIEAPQTNIDLVTSINLYIYAILDFVYCMIWSILLSIQAIGSFVTPAGKKCIEGELALVTGGANGLGKAIARELLMKGTRVAILDVDEEALVNTRNELNSLVDAQDAVRCYSVDVTDTKAVTSVRTMIRHEFNQDVSIVVNNAALIPRVSLLNGSDDDIRRIIDVNYTSQCWILRTFVPDMMKANKGHIVTISSLSAELGLSGAVTYAATKAAIKVMSSSLRDELSDDGYNDINVSIAYPYFIATRLELTEFVKMRFPPLTINFAARSIIDGVLKNRFEIGVPSYSLYLTSLGRLLPETVNQFYRKMLQIEISKFP